MTAAEPVPLPEHIVAAAQPWVKFIAEDGYASLASREADEIARTVAAALTADDIKALRPDLHAEIQASALDDVLAARGAWLLDARLGLGSNPTSERSIRARAAALRDQT